MVYIILIFSILILFLVRLVSDKFSRIVIYLAVVLWLLWVFLSALQLYDFFAIRDITYLYFFTSILMFVLGALSLNSLFRRTSFKKWNSSDLSYNIFDVEFITQCRLFKYTFLISFAEILYLAITQWQVIVLQGSIGSLKVSMFELVFHNNSILYFIYQAIGFPVFHLVMVLESILILQNKKNWLRILLFGAYILTFCFVGAKRGYYSQFLIYFIIIFIFKYKQLINRSISERIKKKSVVVIGLIFGVTFLGASVTTSMYSPDGDGDVNEASKDLFRQVVSYQVAPLIAFDKAVDNNYLSKIGGYQFGRATLGGAVDYYGCSILSMIGVKIRQVRDITMEPLQNDFIYVGTDNTMNFAYTSLIYFYFDLGFFGIIIFSFLFGFIVRYSVYYLKLTKTLGALLLVTFMCYSCQLFFSSWINIALYTQFVILYAFVLSKIEEKHRRIICSQSNEIGSQVL